MVFTTLARIFFRAFTRITSTMGILTFQIIAIYAYHSFLLTNRVRDIFHTYSAYTLLFVPFLYGHRYIHFFAQQISIEDFHNENYVHNFYIWSSSSLGIIDQRPNRSTAVYAAYIFQEGTFGSESFIAIKNTLSAASFAAL